MDDKEREHLETQLSQARALLNQTVDALQEERRLSNIPKNHVSGGYYMMNRTAEKNLRALQKNCPAGALVFSVIRENMQIGTNAVTISQNALGKILNLSRSTIARATKYLSEKNYVQVIKVGNVSSYVVNEQIAFSGSAGQRRAVYSSTIIAHESEQDESWEQVKKLKSIPIIYDDERPILGDEPLPPPDQMDLDLN